MMDENRNQNQIIRKDARSCFVESLSDAFEIGKVHLAFATYDQRSSYAEQKQIFCLSQTADRDKLMPKGLSFRSSATNPKTMFPSL